MSTWARSRANPSRHAQAVLPRQAKVRQAVAVLVGTGRGAFSAEGNRPHVPGQREGPVSVALRRAAQDVPAGPGSGPGAVRHARESAHGAVRPRYVADAEEPAGPDQLYFGQQQLHEQPNHPVPGAQAQEAVGQLHHEVQLADRQRILYFGRHKWATGCVTQDKRNASRPGSKKTTRHSNRSKHNKHNKRGKRGRQNEHSRQSRHGKNSDLIDTILGKKRLPQASPRRANSKSKGKNPKNPRTNKQQLKKGSHRR